MDQTSIYIPQCAPPPRPGNVACGVGPTGLDHRLGGRSQSKVPTNMVRPCSWVSHHPGRFPAEYHPGYHVMRASEDDPRIHESTTTDLMAASPWISHNQARPGLVVVDYGNNRYVL